MAGYIGSKTSVTQVDGYNRTEADDEFVNVTGDTMTGSLDVGGTVTADGLTVDGDATISSGSPTLNLTDTGGVGTATINANLSNIYYTTPSSGRGHYFKTNAGSSDVLSITGGGDISFYEDTGTTAKFFWDASAESLGIGKTDGTTTSVFTVQNVNDVTTNTAEFYNDNGNRTFRFAQDTSGNATQLLEKNDGTDAILLNTNGDSYFNGGNLLVGTTSFDSSVNGFGMSSTGGPLYTTATAQRVAILNRRSSDGEILNFRKDNSTVGSIGTNSGFVFIEPASSGNGLTFLNTSVSPCQGGGAISDNFLDLGTSSRRFDDIYATNGTIQTSDRNEKQDIEALSDAEQRVAVACKGLLRKFRWIDSVAEKGDDARIHFGIIAQDLQDAFTAEGLDAGRYAMFISSTWWETRTEVPAVEAVEAVYEDVVIPAVLDEDGNEVEPERTEQQLVTEAVEAKDAYTRTDTYETLEEAPEGATERTRLGVRYPELLAFIIGAM